MTPAGRDARTAGRTVRTTVLAPAKLNLLLAVGARRADGFHELVTVMQTLDLADRVDVDVELWDSDVVDVLVEAPGVPGGDTLATRAVCELLARAGRGARVWITIDKEIPVGGGLGGGSSDAAAALRAVHELIDEPLEPRELQHIAAALGSDVPFFLLGPGAAAVARGRGELLEAVVPPAPAPWLLAFPRTHQSTAEVYARHDPRNVPPLPQTTADALALARGRPLRNDLTAPAREACPALDRLHAAIEDAGGSPLVCGSGSTVATPLRFPDERRAYEAVIRQAVPGCWTRLAWTSAAAAPGSL